jgi:signal transduction histidine kinase
MKSLAGRLTAWYIGVFVVLLGFVVVVSSLTLQNMLRHEIRIILGARSADVANLGRALGSDEAALHLTAPTIAEDFDRYGIRGAVFDDEGRFLAGDQTQADTGATMAGMKRGQAPPPGLAPPDRGGLRFIPYPGGYLTYQPTIDFFLFNLGSYWLTLAVVLVIALVLAAFAGRILAARALAPIVEVTDALDSLGKGDFSKRASARGEPGEISALARAYNSSVEKVGAAFEERRKTEESMRQFSADAGHELRTPLTVISGYVSVLQRGALSEPHVAADIISTIALECDRMRLLIDKLLALARMDSVPLGELQLFDASKVAAEAVEHSRTLVPDGSLRVEVAGPLEVRAQPDELREAVRNLIENAAKHAPQATIEVRTRRENGTAVIEVSDNGPGMPPEEQVHAFERFYRGALRGDVTGSGLGLAIVKKAIERAGGRVRLESEAGKGTTITLELPLAASEHDGATGM